MANHAVLVKQVKPPSVISKQLQCPPLLVLHLARNINTQVTIRATLVAVGGPHLKVVLTLQEGQGQLTNNVQDAKQIIMLITQLLVYHVLMVKLILIRMPVYLMEHHKLSF